MINNHQSALTSKYFWKEKVGKSNICGCFLFLELSRDTPVNPLQIERINYDYEFRLTRRCR